MSTPTTAVATLPRYHTHYYHHPSYPHQPHGSGNIASTTTTAANYRSAAANAILPPTATTTTTAAASSAARLLPFYGQPATAGSPTGADGLVQSQSSAPRPPPHRDQPDDHHNLLHGLNPSAARHDDSYTSTMASAAGPAQPSRKRRRSHEPDWNNFYRNGLPKEIIVIDDSPEPEANSSRKLTNGNTTVAAAAAARDSHAQQPARKRRRDDDPASSRAAGYHVQYVGSHTNTPLQNTTPIASTLSSDRTNSALHTTAPTSLSSNSQYEDVQAPLKRKRTRQQVANEAKRRDIDGLGNPFFTYKPPPFPPKKAPEVHVRVVHDVSIFSPLL